MSEMLPVDRMHMRHAAAEDEATDGDRPLPAWTIHAAAIGIGLAGQSTPVQMGAGWTNYFASGKGTCNANSMTEKHVWFYVYENIML